MEASRRCHNHEFLLSKATGRYRQLNSSYRVAPNHYKFMENRYGGMKVSNDLLTLGFGQVVAIALLALPVLTAIQVYQGMPLQNVHISF